MQKAQSWEGVKKPGLDTRLFSDNQAVCVSPP